MIDRVKLRQQYKQETGEDWKMLQSTAQPTVDYTKWLEDRLTQGQELPISNVVGRSEQLLALANHIYSDMLRSDRISTPEQVVKDFLSK